MLLRARSIHAYESGNRDSAFCEVLCQLFNDHVVNQRCSHLSWWALRAGQIRNRHRCVTGHAVIINNDVAYCDQRSFEISLGRQGFTVASRSYPNYR